MDKGEISSVEAEEFVELLKNVHEDVRKHIIKMNTKCKDKVDLKLRYKKF